MPTVTAVNDLKINRLTEAQYDAAVQAGIIGENELSIITDLEGGQVIQVDTLPTASADELDKIYQYIGTTDQNYTNGYFYKCIMDTNSSSVTCTEVMTNTGVTITMDIDGFVNYLVSLGANLSDISSALNSDSGVFEYNKYDDTLFWSWYDDIFGKPTGNWAGSSYYNEKHTAASFVSFTPDLGPAVDDSDVVIWKTSNYGSSYSWQQVNVQPAVDPLPDQTGNAGKFLTTDGTNASWGDTLVNQATNNALSVMTAKSSTQSTYIGYEAGSNSGNYSVYIGYGANSNGGSGHYNVCIGASAHTGSNVGGAIQLGQGLNSESGTMCVALSDSVGSGRQNYKLLDLDGTIPEARLADTTNAQEGQALTLDSNGQATWSSAAKTPQTMPELTVNGWALDPNTNKITQTVNVTGVTAINNVIVSPAPNSATDYSDASILCTAQGSGTLTFTCETTPTNAITVNVLIF